MASNLMIAMASILMAMASSLQPKETSQHIKKTILFSPATQDALCLPPSRGAARTASPTQLRQRFCPTAARLGFGCFDRLRPPSTATVSDALVGSKRVVCEV